MRTIKDKELHEKYCNICIDSPNSLFASLDESSKSIIRQTSICKMYRKGDLIYEEGNKPFGLICLITGKAKIAKKGIAGREQIVRMAKPVGFIGYRAFFAEEMHIASAEALEESIVCIMKTGSRDIPPAKDLQASGGSLRRCRWKTASADQSRAR